VSKYYGESERLLASIFTAGNELPEGAIIFLDEIDSMAMTRDGEMHEATRRMLSVLLRQMDGFEQDKRIVVIAATNRKQDLDPALLSRFDTSVAFNLPDQSTREEITSQYARHLTSTELKAFGSACEGMSGRDIHDVCQQAERRWASKVTCLTCFSAYVLSSKVSRSLPKSFKSILGLQVCSCFFLLNDVFVSSIVPSSFLLLWFEVHLYLWNIFVFKRYNWTKLDFKLVQRVEALEITIQILNQVSTGNKYSKNLPSLTPSSGWRS
jgi:hypothetical protein